MPPCVSAALAEREKGKMKRVHHNNNKNDIKDAREQERWTLTKEGKALSRDLCPIRDTE